MKPGNPLNPEERRITMALAQIFFLRMMGLFMLIPVLATYSETLPGADPWLIGLAIGIYGLTQAICQIPLGRLSDHIGRRPVIIAGLAIFTVGALIAALANSIWPILIGRAVQGLGAVSGASLALAADHSRDEQRTKIMALLGVSIGGAFSVAFVLGPWLDGQLGLRGLFLTAALLAVGAAIIAWLKLPKGSGGRATSDAAPSILASLTAANLRVLYLGVGALHCVLAASFVAIPVALVEGLGIPSGTHARVYLPVLGVAIVLTGPLIMLSTRRALADRFFLLAIVMLTLSELGFALWWDSTALFGALVTFFIAFNFIEASLPSIIAKLAPASGKGTALGAYATFQFLGMFAGGVLGGAVAALSGPRQVPLAAAALCALWLAATLWQPRVSELSQKA